MTLTVSLESVPADCRSSWNHSQFLARVCAPVSGFCFRCRVRTGAHTSRPWKHCTFGTADLLQFVQGPPNLTKHFSLSFRKDYLRVARWLRPHPNPVRCVCSVSGLERGMDWCRSHLDEALWLSFVLFAAEGSTFCLRN